MVSFIYLGIYKHIFGIHNNNIILFILFLDTWDFYGYQGDLQTPKAEDGEGPESSSDGASDSGEEQQKILKEVKFPETEKEKHPHQCSQQVSRCIGKRVEKLTEEITKLEAITNPNTLQSKFLDSNLILVLHQWCLGVMGHDKWQVSFHPSSLNGPSSTSILRLLARAKELKNDLTSCDERINDKHSHGMVNGFSKECLGRNNWWEVNGVDVQFLSFTLIKTFTNP